MAYKRVRQIAKPDPCGVTGRSTQCVARGTGRPRRPSRADGSVPRGGHPSRGRHQALRDDHGRRRPDALDRARRVLRHARPVGLRQDDHAADDRRLRGPDRRARRSRRRGRHRAPALQARRQHGLPVLRAVPAPQRRAERRLRPRAQEGRQGRGPRARRRDARARAARAAWPSASPRSSPAASSSASRWPARWSTARARCCSTSRSARSTCACASQLQIELKRIQQDVGITFVHVTHDQEEAMTMADTIAVMNEGRIEQAGGGRPSSTSARGPPSWRTSSASRT